MTDNTTQPPTDGGTPDPSLLAGAGGDPPAAPGPNDWMPTKFHVNNDAGEFDESASARKLAESYAALEKHKGPVLKAPETPEGYVIEAPKDADGKPIVGIDVAEFVKDPMYQGLAKKAHAAGIPNEHMQFFVQEYLQMAPSLFEVDRALTLDEASAILTEAWGDEATFKKNVDTAREYVEGFSGKIADGSPGNFAALDSKFGKDPDFVAFMAVVGDECRAAGLKFGGDTPVGNAKTSGVVDYNSIALHPGFRDQNHPEHQKLRGQWYAAFGNKLPE